MPEKKPDTTEYAPFEAVFIGSRGETLGAQYKMLEIYNTVFYYDANGQQLDTSLPEYQGKTPAEMRKLGAVERKVYEFEIGDIVTLPVWDDEKLQLALSLKQFAKPEAQELVKTAHKEAYAASEAVGGDLVAYAARISQLLSDLEQQGLLLTPADGEFVKAVYEGG